MYSVRHDQWIPRNLSEASICASSIALRAASYLTDPICKAREYFVRSRMLEELPTASPRISDFVTYVSKLPCCSFLSQDEHVKWIEYCYLRIGACALMALGSITAPVGIVLRAMTNCTFLHYKGSFSAKERDKNQFSHLLRNICGIKGGYDIEEGAQMPIRDDLNYPENDRLDRLIMQFKEHDPDVLCLNEVYDINDAHYIVHALRHRYAHFIIHCGSRTVGPNSGLFFASKFAVTDAQFLPFPKDMLIDKAKQCEKGVLVVDIEDSQGVIGTIALTHAQHSDQVQHSSPAEKQARIEECRFIQQYLEDKDRVVWTGDLNMTDEEMTELSNEDFYKQLTKTVHYVDNKENAQFTWGGDSWYVRFGNKTADSPTFPTSSDRLKPREISAGCNLDHTMVSENTMSIESFLVEDAISYDPDKITRESLSDHRGLWSIIDLK